MISKKKKKDNGMPRYKRKLRILCWKLSKNLKLENKVNYANEWAAKHPKRFLYITIGILSFCVISSFVSLGISYMQNSRRKAQPQKEVVDEPAQRGEGDIQVLQNVSGLRQIDANRNVMKKEVRNLTDDGLKVKRELDSLLALPEKSSQDSIRIVQDYNNLKSIVDFLNKSAK